MTNSQSDKITNSRVKPTNSHSKNKSFIGRDVVQETFGNDLTNSQQNEITNSRNKLTNSQNTGAPGTKKITIPEHIKIAWIDLAPSISSAFSKRKWPTKNKMFKIFENWFNELVEGE